MREAGQCVTTAMRQTLHSAYLCNVGYNELVTQNRQLLLLCFCSTFYSRSLPFLRILLSCLKARASVPLVYNPGMTPDWYRQNIEYVPAEDPPRIEMY
jgi:hypothetical protein